MNEEYCYLPADGERLFAGLHRPVNRPDRGLVICHPLGEEKLWAHRVMVTLARDLADSGIAVMRFDFRGEGESDRDFAQSDLNTRIADASHAMDCMLKIFPSLTDLTVLGLRLGASVAASAASRRRDISRLILWDPVVDGAAYAQTVLRLNLMQQMALHRKVIETREALVARLVDGGTVNIEGYELSNSLYQQLTSFSLQDVLAAYSGQIVLVQISPRESDPRQELASIAASLGECRLEVAHEEPFWREIKPYYQRAEDLTRITIQALSGTA